MIVPLIGLGVAQVLLPFLRPCLAPAAQRRERPHRQPRVQALHRHAAGQKAQGQGVNPHPVPRTTHGMTGSKTYKTWRAMKTRCFNSRCDSWPNYGGRGITVCARWMQFEHFLADMGLAPTGASLDRINNEGNYEPGNCRWTDVRTQSNNTRVNRRITHDGKTRTLAEWARLSGIRPDTLSYRLRRGWSLSEALTIRPGSSGKHATVLDEQQARRVKYGGESPTKLSREFAVTVTTIYQIRQGRTWSRI